MLFLQARSLVVDVGKGVGVDTRFIEEVLVRLSHLFSGSISNLFNS